jgi:hypothetical protein
MTSPALPPIVLNGYVCFYRGRRLEVRAATSLSARDEAAKLFKARKAFEVTAVLAERADGATVVQSLS